MLICLMLALTPDFTLAQADSKDGTVSLTKLFHNFGAHFVGSFTYNYGANHVLAIATSYGLIETGADWKLHEFARDNQSFLYSHSTVGIIGAMVPFFAPMGLYSYGKSHDDQQLQITALGLGQAALLSVLITSGYKTVTGRENPDNDEDQDTPDYSDDFKFGFLRRGVIFGWPSGHTTTAVAMATTLI